MIIGSCLLVKKIMQQKAITNGKTAQEIFQVINWEIYNVNSPIQLV